jgi:hypothetical protein
MSHFARINEDNIVTDVIVGDNSLPNEGYDWIVSRFGGTWIKTSYNGNIRKRFAGLGFSYDEELDAFLEPKPYDSWVINQETASWEPPVPRPEEGAYVWDESTVSWLEDQTPIPPIDPSEEQEFVWDEDSGTWVAL